MSVRTLNDKALQGYYEALFQMYPTEGWKRLVEDFQFMKETHTTVADLQTVEQLWQRKGQLEIIDLIVGHKAAHEAAYEELLNRQDEPQIGEDE